VPETLHIEPPAHAFTRSFQVANSDIDELGHVGNVTWVQWVNDAATVHSASVGLDLDAYRKMGMLWVVRRHDVLYRGPAFVGDPIEARTWIASARGAASVRRTCFQRASDRALLVQAETTWALIAIATGKPTRIPRELSERYGVIAA
jgi:acyl-CoA thioester hydrolase